MICNVVQLILVSKDMLLRWRFHIVRVYANPCVGEKSAAVSSVCSVTVACCYGDGCVAIAY